MAHAVCCSILLCGLLIILYSSCYTMIVKYYVTSYKMASYCVISYHVILYHITLYCICTLHYVTSVYTCFDVLYLITLHFAQFPVKLERFVFHHTICHYNILHHNVQVSLPHPLRRAKSTIADPLHKLSTHRGAPGCTA